MISEKESYEEIVTGSIYNETTITDQIHTKWAGKTVHFARETDSTNLWIKRLAKEPYEGVARGITDGGELLVEKTDGTIVAVSAGEVSVRGLYSYV